MQLRPIAAAFREHADDGPENGHEIHPRHSHAPHPMALLLTRTFDDQKEVVRR
jgi:hypothetical protein